MSGNFSLTRMGILILSAFNVILGIIGDRFFLVAGVCGVLAYYGLSRQAERAAAAGKPSAPAAGGE